MKTDLFDRHSGPTTGFAHPQIMKIDVDTERLKKIVHQFEEWKQDYAQLMQRYDVKLQHSREKQAMLNSEQVSVPSSMFSCSIHFPPRCLREEPICRNIDLD